MLPSHACRLSIWILAMVLLALGMAGCSPRQAEDEATLQPARLTIELSGTTTTPGSLWLQVESVVLMPQKKESFRSRFYPKAATAEHPAFFFALPPETFVLDADGAVLAREVRVAPGRYRELRLRLGSASAMDSGERRVPVTGGGSVPLELELASGEQATLAIRVDTQRSLRDSGGAMVFDPVLMSASVLPGAAEAHGTIRGRVVPAGAGAMIVIYGSDASDSRSFTFADPRSGDFALDELPVGKYRVEVNPLEPAGFEARVFDGIGVPWDGLRDLGAIDLRPATGPSTGEAAGSD